MGRINCSSIGMTEGIDSLFQDGCEELFESGRLELRVDMKNLNLGLKNVARIGG